VKSIINFNFSIINLNFELTPAIQNYLQWLSDKTIVIWFSGWPDSVVTYELIRGYYQSQFRDTDQIFLAHFDHKSRKESSSEADFIKNNYKNSIMGEYSQKSKKEADYRKERHEFFKQCLADKNTSTLILGHNLSDRLETTLMNIERGAGANGIGNMQEIDHKEYLLESHYVILRPLLSFPKHYIMRYCEANNLQYFTDVSNADPNVSKRNKIRAEIIKPLELGDKEPLLQRRETYKNIISESEFFACYELFEIQKSDFWEHLQWRYEIFYTRSKALSVYCKRIDFPEYFGFQYLYQLGNWFFEEDLVELLKAIGEYGNTTTARLKELLCFIHHSKSGYKIIWKWKLYSSHNRFYLVLENKKQDIGQVLTFWLQSNLEDKANIRMIDLALDYYNGKSINKYLINNKVPVFLRNLVPVKVDETGKIVKPLIQLVLNKIHEWLNG
jgi:tRNA(Ile)-lysidine synthetase-like protein